MPNFTTPNSDSLPQPPDNVQERKDGPEIHSAKWHRCVDKVKARGGGYNAYAVCTSSIGKSGTFAKGHGGSATPKRKIHEAEMCADCKAGKPCPMMADKQKRKKKLAEKGFSKAAPGSGGRFAACKAKMAAKGGVDDPAAMCAAIGRRKYGGKQMAKWAAKGRAREAAYDLDRQLDAVVEAILR